MSFQLVDKRDRELNLKLRSIDGRKTVEVDPMCCYESEEILGYINIGLGFTHAVPVAIKSKIIKLVNELCTKRWKIINTTSDDAVAGVLDDFDSNFVLQQPLPILLNLMHAADYLGIESLLNVTCNAILVMLVGKSADEIIEIFDMIGFSRKVFEEEME